MEINLFNMYDYLFEPDISSYSSLELIYLQQITWKQFYVIYSFIFCNNKIFPIFVYKYANNNNISIVICTCQYRQSIFNTKSWVLPCLLYIEFINRYRTFIFLQNSEILKKCSLVTKTQHVSTVVMQFLTVNYIIVMERVQISSITPE